MKISLETTTKTILVQEGMMQPADELRMKYGEGTRLEVRCLRDGIPITPTLNEQFKFIVKKQNVFSVGGIVAGIDAFTYDSAIGCFVGEINFNVTAITSALHQAQGAQDQQDAVMFWAELEFRNDTSSGWQRSQLIKKFWIDNALWKGTETIPGGGSTEPTSGPWRTPLIMVQPGDAVNSTTTLEDVPGLTFPVEANKLYHFRFVMHIASVGATTGIRLSLNGPTTTLLTFRTECTASATNRSVKEGNTGYGQPAAAYLDILAAGTMGVMEGFIRCSAAGMVIARFASEVGGNAVTVKSGSMVTFAKLE